MEPVWLNSYPREVDPAPVVPDGSVAALIRDSCRRYAEREAYWSAGRSLTFGETYDLASALARWLRHQGFMAGERAAIMLPNVLAFPIATYGVLLAGGVVVNVNPHYTARELAHQLTDAGTRTLIVWEPALPAVEAAAIALERVVTVAPRALLTPLPARAAARRGAGRPGRFSLEEVLAQAPAGTSADALPEPPPPDPQRPVFLQYTGGTTGLSKGAVLTERNVRGDLAQQLAWTAPFLAGHGPQRMLTPLPLYHIAALMAGMFRRLVDGSCCLLVADPRNIDALVDIMITQRFTVIGGVNTLYAALLDHPRIREVDFTPCRFAVAGATATQQAVVDRWFELTGLSIVEGYGLTETCCYVSQLPLDGRPFNGSVGLPLPLTELAILDARGAEQPIGAPGEICVRGPQVMAGYWNRPAESAAAFTAAGFVRTGDIGWVDEAGYLRLSDRKKDMILVSGFNVFPTEIEGVLLQHPKVLEAAVVATPDRHSGEVPVAFVVRRDASLTGEELHVHCRTRLTGYKRPKRFEFRDTLPKTPVGKILRRALRDAAD